MSVEPLNRISVEQRLDNLTIIFLSLIVFVTGFFVLGAIEYIVITGDTVLRFIVPLLLSSLTFYVVRQPNASLSVNKGFQYIEYSKKGENKEKITGKIMWNSVNNLSIEPNEENKEFFNSINEFDRTNLWRTNLSIEWTDNYNEDKMPQKLIIKGDSVNYENFVLTLVDWNYIISSSEEIKFVLNRFLKLYKFE
jgi:hypothetical protein